MTRTLTVLALAAATAGLLGAPAHASEAANGLSRNGFTLNGISHNGFTLNGLKRNGFTLNGLKRNGFTLNGLKRNGFTLNGQALHGVAATTADAAPTVKAVRLPAGKRLTNR